MREVNNNTANPSNVNYQGIQAKNSNTNVPPEVFPMESSDSTDLGKMPAEIIGRSQVSKTSHQKDVEFAVNHPEKLEDLDRYFNYLIGAKGLSYEEACAVIGATAEEFYGA